MILDKIVEKVLLKKLKNIKDLGVNYINNHKDEIIELVKKQVKIYIDEHKEEIINIAEKKIVEIMKELMV